MSAVRRTVWDGNHALAEIDMPATDSTASTTIENDTLSITRTVPGTGDALYDANRLYGQVLYMNGLETDQPLAITRNHYADASSTTGSVTYAVYAPFSIVPLWNRQGRADRAVIGGTAAPGQDALCADTGKTRCANVYLDQGVFPYARSGAAMGSWNGTVLVDKADATGTYYRRNRTYDPATARFTQEDPIGLAGGLSAYGFASGDPANYSDPFSLCKDKNGNDRPCEVTISPEGKQLGATLEGLTPETLRRVQELAEAADADLGLNATTNGTHSDPGHKNGTAVDIGWINGKDIGNGASTNPSMLDLSLKVQQTAAGLGGLKNTGNLGPAGKFNGPKGPLPINDPKIRDAHKNHIHLSYDP